MPAQLLSTPNPPPGASQLPPAVDELQVKLKLDVLSKDEVNDLQAFRRAADYIAAGTLFAISLQAFPVA